MNYNEFNQSILMHKKIIQIEKIGISETTFCNVYEFKFYIECFFIYTIEGNLLLSYYSNNEENNFNPNNIFKNIISSSFLKGNFFEILLGKKKIILFRHFLVYIIITKNNIKGSLIKFYLKFISNAYLNFIGENKEYSNKLYYISNIFENFFIKSLTNKFIKILKSLVFRPQNNSTQIKFKNITIIDCNNNNTILFNLKKIIKPKGIIRQINKESKIYQLLLHNLIKFKDYYSTKIILLSTYPRLYFISKYLKINNGIGIIELYSSNRLSRASSEYSEYEFSIQKKKEEYLSTIPLIPLKDINYIEKFLKSYLTSINPNIFLYHDINYNLPYIDYDLLNIIDDSLKLRISYDNLITYLNKKICISLKNSDKLKTKTFQSNKSNTPKNDNSRNKSDNNFVIEKYEILSDLYPINEENKFSSIIDNTNILEKIDKNNNIFDGQSEISIIEKSGNDFGSIISNLKDRSELISLSGNYIEESKNIIKKEKNEVLKDLQNILLNYDTNPFFSSVNINIKNFDFTPVEKETISPITFGNLLNKMMSDNNNIKNTINSDNNKNNKDINILTNNDLIEKNDISEFYGDKSSQEIISYSPTFANLNKRRKLK